MILAMQQNSTQQVGIHFQHRCMKRNWQSVGALRESYLVAQVSGLYISMDLNIE